MLGNIASGRDGPADPSEAALWYRRAADQGLAAAEAKLGACYAAGSGVPQSDVQAVKWYRRAASHGDIQAAASLGYFYQFGEGIPRDDTEAAHWYGVAAKGGDPLSQSTLADFFTTGTGVTRSEKDAARWRRRAAEQGDPESQYALARAYYEGSGVARDPVGSYFWATVAIGQFPENRAAREPTLRLLAALARDLTQNQMEEASRRAAQWHPAPGTTENYDSPDGTLRAVVVVTRRGGESEVELREGADILLTRAYSSLDGQHGFVVQRAEWTPDSRFFVFSLASSGGHQPWHYPTYFYSRGTNRIETLERYTGPVAGPEFRLSAPDTISVMTARSAENRDTPKEVHVRLGGLRPRKPAH